MNQKTSRPGVVGGIVLLSGLLIVGAATLYAWQGPLFAAHDDIPTVTSSALACGSLFQIQRYDANPKYGATSAAPWIGLPADGSPYVDHNFRAGCLADARAASVWFASGLSIEALLVLAGVAWLVTGRSRRVDRSPTEAGLASRES